MSGRSHWQQWRRLSVIEPNDNELPGQPSPMRRPTGLATRIIMSNARQDPAKLLKIAKTKDVPPGQAAAFTIEGQKIALFNVEGTYYAIGDTCTHRGGPLSEGDVQGTRVTCPWHGAD
jgi:hypothetical protein